MSIIEYFRSLFITRPHPNNEEVPIDAIFRYLIGLVKNPDLITPHLEHIKASRIYMGDDRDSVLIHSYLELEQAIILNQPRIVDEVFTLESLHEHIRKEVGITTLPNVFRLIFLPEAEQKRSIYERALQSLLSYMNNYIGELRVSEILRTLTKGTVLETRIDSHGTLDSTGIEKSSIEQVQEVLAALKDLYTKLFAEIVRSFGESKAIDLCRTDYLFFRQTYGTHITSTFLGILPEGVLELERLAFLSRQELEERIRESTKELKELNGQLEQKVEERTRELTEANRHLTEIDTAKTEFISVAAHQLRTPLTAIKWVFSVLTDEDDENLAPRQRGLLMKGAENTERIIALVNEMLVVTRIESGRVTFSFEPIHIEDLIENVLIDFIGETRARNIHILFERPQPVFPYVLIDGEKIRAVIQNLIENAIKYTPDGGTIKISLTSEGAYIKVMVQDTGIGIPEKQQGAIFNKFFRADNAVKTQTDGSGLGLFIAKNNIKGHGGVIGFESKENEGTLFYFTVPIAKDLPPR